MLRSINSNTGSTLSSYEANPNNNPSPLASTSISEQYSTPSPSQGAAKVVLSEEARKISLILFAHEANSNSPLKRDESFFQQEAVAQRKIESGDSLAEPVAITPADNSFQIEGVSHVFNDGTLEKFIAERLDGKAKNASLVASELGKMLRGTILNPDASIEERAVSRETALKHATYIAENYFDNPDDASAFMENIERFANNDVLREKGYVVIDNSGLPPLPSYQSFVKPDIGISLDAYAKHYGLAHSHELFADKQTFNAFYSTLIRHGDLRREEIVQRFADNEKMVAEILDKVKNHLDEAKVASSLQQLLKAI